MIEQKRRSEEYQARAQALMSADMFDVDAQRQIEEQIRMGNVQENMEAAMEVCVRALVCACFAIAWLVCALRVH